MKYKKIIAATLGLSMTFSTAAVSACGNKSESQDSYLIVYNLNYGSEETRELSVPRGYAGIEWSPRREGYDLLGWYTDEACTKPYDFSKGVYSDLVLYAGWDVAKAVYTVSIDGNYAGVKSYSSLSVTEGSLVEEAKLPDVYKFGMELEGWYTDAACTHKYDFAKPVTSDFTLYANYVFNDEIERYDEDDPENGVKAGDIKFEDLTLNVWYGTSMTGLFKGLTNIVTELAEEFNEQPSNILRDENGDVLYDSSGNPRHKINVVTYSGTLTQSEYQLRLQQTPEKNKSKYYLNAGAVLDAANGDSSYYDPDGWYAINDSYVSGALGSIPLGCKVPFLVYNKAQMDKYCGKDKVPANYSELVEVLKTAYASEVQANSAYQTFIMNGYWPFQQNLSMISFVQNGAPYYTYDSIAGYTTPWADVDVQAKALAGAKNLYNLISSYGECHGGLTSRTTKDDATVVSRVSNGTALAGVVSWYDDKATSESNFLLSKIANDDNLGVLPLSGLFTDDSDGWYANAIPVNTLGLQICTYQSTRTDMYYAACAIFADYVAQHAERFIDEGIVPMNKQVYEQYVASVDESEASDAVKIMKKMGDPENFFTLDGYANGKSLVVEFGGTTSGGIVTNPGYVGNILSATSVEEIEEIIAAATVRLKANF